MSAQDYAVLIAALVGAFTGVASAINSFSSSRQAARKDELERLRAVIEIQGAQIAALQTENEKLHRQIDALQRENEELRRRAKGW